MAIIFFLTEETFTLILILILILVSSYSIYLIPVVHPSETVVSVIISVLTLLKVACCVNTSLTC